MTDEIEEINETVLTQRIKALLERPKTKDLVQRYFNPHDKEPFAGNLFDTLGTNDPARFGTDDLLALNLLDEPVNAYQLKCVMSGAFDDMIRDIDQDSDIRALSGDTYKKANELWHALKEVHGFGPTRVSKLLARKRPKLLPIRDSIINEILGIKGYSWWTSLSKTMSQTDVIDLLEEFNPCPDDGGPTLLRVLDVAVWMHGSRAEAARQVRREFGLTD